MMSTTSTPLERMLHVASTLFYQEGIEAVSVDRIAHEAEVAPMTLYRRFSRKDGLVAAALQRWSLEWLRWLEDQIDGCGEDPAARFAGLWDALAKWLATTDFQGSLIANAAIELRSKPDHPGHGVIAEHRAALRQLLEDLAETLGARDPKGPAARLQILLDGAITAAVVDRRPAVALDLRALGNAALLPGPS